MKQERLNLFDTIYANSYFDEFYSQKLLNLPLFVATFISTVPIYIFPVKYQLSLAPCRIRLQRVCSVWLRTLITSYSKEAINTSKFKHVFLRESIFFEKRVYYSLQCCQKQPSKHTKEIGRYLFFYHTHLPQISYDRVIRKQ